MRLTDQEAIQAFCDSTSVQLALSSLCPAPIVSPRIPLLANGNIDNCSFQPWLSSPRFTRAPCSSVSFSNHSSPVFSSFPKRRVLSMSSMHQRTPNPQLKQTFEVPIGVKFSSPQRPLDHFRSPVHSLSSTRSLSDIDLLGTIGCGAYGKVLLGHLHENTTPDTPRKLCAIKVLRKTGMKQNETEEVKRELRTLRWIKGLDDANGRGVNFLQTMSESFQNDQFVFMILEYHPVSLENPEVASRLRLQPATVTSRLSSVSLPLVLEDGKYQSNALASFRLLAAELVLGLTFLHGSGIVHQDIKPANIMVSSSGHAIISDFGASSLLPLSFDYDDFSARFLESPAKKTFHPIVLPPHTFISLTPLYAAPEIRHRDPAGHVIYDQKVDWWSLGVMLYELATGAIPFRFLPIPNTSVRDRLWRRTAGDFSLAFGELEKIVARISNLYAGEDGSHLEGFLRAVSGYHSLCEEFCKLRPSFNVLKLLVDQPHNRLGDEDVKDHPFFGPIYSLWEDIAALSHPPLPNPPSVALDPNVSLSMSMVFNTSDSASDMAGFAEELSSLAESDPGSDQDEVSTARATSTPTAELETSTASVSDDVYAKADPCDDEFDAVDAAGCYVPTSPEDGHTSVDLTPLDDTASALQPFPSTASLHCVHFCDSTVSVAQPTPKESDHGNLELKEQTLRAAENDSEIDEVVFMSSLRSGQRSGRVSSWTTADVIGVDSHVSSESHLSRAGDFVFSPRPPVEPLLLTSAQNHNFLAGLALPRSCPPVVSSSPPLLRTSFTPRNRQAEPLQDSTNSQKSKQNRWKRLSAPFSQLGHSLSQPGSKFSLPRPKRLSLISKPDSLSFSPGQGGQRRLASVTQLFPFLPSPGHTAIASPSPLLSNLSFQTDEYACVRAPSRYQAQTSILPTSDFEARSPAGSPDTQLTLSPDATDFPDHRLCRVQCRTPRQRVRVSAYSQAQRQDSLVHSESVAFPLASPLSPRLPNPYSPSPADENWRFIEDLAEPVTLEERLTIEVLNAMDTRDRSLELEECVFGRERRLGMSGSIRNIDSRKYSTPAGKGRSVSLGLNEAVGRNNKMKRRAVSVGVGTDYGHRRRTVYGGEHEVSSFASPNPSSHRPRRSSLLGLGLLKSPISRQVQHSSEQPEVGSPRNAFVPVVCLGDFETDGSSQERTQSSSRYHSSVSTRRASVKMRAGSHRQRAQSMTVHTTPLEHWEAWERKNMSQPLESASKSSVWRIWTKLKKFSKRQKEC
ncbi:hypothetical protein D9758_005417 [Tetrapyrgos nigripes]|uniref:non-specific serine/threonine protein kinase n=1 Tax=Tetrapyrgos nigripes TaxID=182062 RepID=A0A8H5GHU7_9AGAR|nr:hypothetical protein D9758_005417 [Tetrapyrgos nigripes]